MNCIFYYFTTQGVMLKDSITEKPIHYIGYTLKQAIKRHRIEYNLQRKHFRIIKL